MDKGKYLLKNEDRVKFRIRVPRELWDWLPKIIARDLSAPDTTEIGSRCQACGQRLRSLFDRAVKGMVDRTLLRELVNEICNEELYRNTPPAEIVNIRQPIPNQPDLLQAFLAQVLRSLNININLPTVTNQPREPLETAVVSKAPTPHQIHTLRETCDLYFKEKGSNVGFNPKTEKDRRNSLALLMEYLGEDFDIGKITRGMMVDVRMNLLQKYPLHRKKLYPNMPLMDVLRLKTVKAYISESTQSRYMEFWSGFFNWAVQADYIAKNPAAGLYDRSEFYDVRELRPPFTIQELTSIYARRLFGASFSRHIMLSA